MPDARPEPDTIPRGKSAMSPLNDITVLDFSWLLPGPFCSQLLAELGAKVIKIESPAGDYVREMFPGMFSTVNHGKRGLCIDLKAEGALDVIDSLVAGADVVMEGFRPGVAARLGIGYGRLSAVRPGLVYASFSGYGASGPDASRPGHDLNYCAAAGILSIPGRWEEPPARSGLPLGDLSASLYGALSIVSAVRARDQSGSGAFLDIGMLECLLSMGQVRFADYLLSGEQGWQHVSPLNDVFETRDGRLVALGLVEDKFLSAFCAAADIDEGSLNADLALFNEKNDTRSGKRLRQTIADAVRQRTAAEWEKICGEGIPFSVVLSPKEALSQAQAVQADIIGESGAGVPRVKFPVPGLASEEMRPAPDRGEHNRDILAEFGYGEDDVLELSERGIIV